MNNYWFFFLVLAIPILGVMVFAVKMCAQTIARISRKIREIWRKFRKKPTRVSKIEPHL